MPADILSQDEVDALLKGVSDEPADEAEAAPSSKEPRPYDLATQERIVRGRMPTLEIINDRFARLLRIGIFNLVRRNPEIAVEAIKVQKFSEYIRNLVVPTNLNIMQIRPLRGNSLFVFEPTLVFSIVDSMFGGDGRFHTRVEGREFSQTEYRIIRNLLDMVCENYQKSWAPVHPLTFDFVRSEMHTQFASIATPSEVVVVSSFRIELGSVTGSISICIPYSTLEPIRDALYGSVQGDNAEPDRRWTRMLSRQVQLAEVTLVADFAQIPTTIKQLVSMKAGDVITFEAQERVTAEIDGVPMFECAYGTRNGKLALKVDKFLAIPPQDNMLGD
jgi:flagellar motor switch protein FliM